MPMRARRGFPDPLASTLARPEIHEWRPTSHAHPSPVSQGPHELPQGWVRVGSPGAALPLLAAFRSAASRVEVPSQGERMLHLDALAKSSAESPLLSWYFRSAAAQPPADTRPQ